MSDNIKVVVKVRPLISREIEEKLSYQWRVNNDTLNQLDQNGREFGASFTFDKVYDKDTKTQEVYNDVAKPIVEAAIAGFNGTIFAYGQTSSGKTYTMTGTESSPGIIPLAVLNLFETIKTIPDRDFLVRVSYIEIYNETLRDLLDVNKKNVKVHDTIQGVKVDASEKVTSSPEEVLDAMKEGEANRQTGATNMNEESSRSHSIFQITIESREHIEGEEEAGCVNVSQLNLVDLAGSERSGQTGATGIRFKEGTHINKSLSVLALVIKQLSEDPNKFANYRDSKLTRILQNSLGGNAKTSIICAITPASVEETISTLQFANRAKAIKNKPQVNAVATNATMIQSLTKQLSKLQSQLESKKNVEQNNATLQKRIEAMRKMILNGFHQRSSLDMMGTNRRKQQPLRRITISTLHPIEEDPVPNVPRFCTPSLKYNPMSISTEFLPIQNASNNKLASLPEETRMITPPPHDKKVDTNDEIIELDSDDDTDVQECSPYHKCYGSSKTPPCILRKNAKLAEKSLKDIVELTEREKMYVPSVIMKSVPSSTVQIPIIPRCRLHIYEVELIEKLEQNTNVIARLEDEINTLSEQSKTKDLELEQLRNKISKTEEQVQTLTNAKAELEILCSNYNIKLTDWEVSYDTLKKKAKSREDDLLSLLEEQKVLKKSEDIGKLARKELDKELVNFMDMSKDISLVNSDNESNVTNVNDEESSGQIQELVTELQSQLTSKSQTVIELESNIFDQKKKIESLENTSHELQIMIDSLKEKFSHMETENSYLKSTVETLNSTINSQQACIETANNDIQSYNAMIEDLQVKLNKKDTLLSVNITDSVLESMIANEERFIANNDNMKNLIYSFKMTLDSRNKEIDSLKSAIQSSTDLLTDNTALKEQVEIKENQIFTLNEELDKLKGQLSDNIEIIENLKSTVQSYTQSSTEVIALKDQVEVKENQNAVLIKEVEQLKGQLNENIEMIENLKSTYQSNTELSTHNLALKEQVESKEKQIELLIEEAEKLKGQIDENIEMINKLMSLEKQLSSKVCEVEEQNTLLQTNVDEKSTQIMNLNEQYERLTSIISEKEAKQQEISDLNENLSKQIDDMSQKISYLEKDITLKDSLISSLNNIDDATQKHLSTAKSSVHKLHNILTKLKCNTHDIPEVIDNIELFFSSLNDSLNILDTQVTHILEDNKQTVEQTVELKEQITSLLKKYQTETEKLQMQIGDISKERNEIINQYEELSNQILDLTQELDKVRQQQDAKDLVNIDLETKLNDAKESNENLRNDLLSKDDMVLSLQEKISALNNEIELMSQNNEQNHIDLKQKIDNLNANQESLEQMLETKDAEISVLQNALEEQRILVTTLTQKLDENRDSKDQLLNDILNKVCKVTHDFSIENNLSCDIKNGDNVYEKILLTLDKIANHIMIIKTENDCEQTDIEAILSEAKVQITDLTQKNLELMKHFAEIEFKNQELFDEMEKIKKINNQLSGTNEILDQLKIELEMKASDLESMEVKANALKTNFEEFECVVKEQMKELQTENELLKDRISESKKIAIKHDNIENNIRKSLSNIAENVDRKSPQSLLTICCNKIIEAMEPDENDLKSVTTSSSKGNIEYQNSEKQNSICKCSELSSELRAAHEENSNLKEELEHLKSLNLHLIEEQEEVRKEIQLLVEPANELQKKIINHRTNLSTLTATTYAENKLLNSQLKVLKHHHTRYIHVCQRDIPAFKSQLHELMAMLKGISSSTDKQNQNASFKRFSLPDVLDTNNTVSNFNNESTLDGDLLMLDTNVTLTTSADNTLMGNDQSCLDITQINFDSEVACQTSDSSKILDPCLVYSQMEILTIDNQKMYEKLEALQEENRKLQEQINKYTSKESSVQKVDAQSSPIKLNGSPNDSFSNTLTDDLSTCRNSRQDECAKDMLVEEIRLISQELTEVKAQKEEIEKKYANLTLEIPSTDALVKKICILEKEYHSKTQENSKLINDLKKKNMQIKDLQEENDTLSNQVMENISEADDLRKKLDMLKEVTNELKELDNIEKLKETTNSLKELNCPQCKMKDELINTLQSKQNSEAHSKLNRSFSDSDSSSRFTKIYTLQNELHASKEDCKKITEEVATIKNQLDRSNLTISESMDLDGSMGDSNIFTFNTNYGGAEPHLNKFSMPNIAEERSSDMYTIDKIDCFNYYVEITDTNKENLNSDVKIIDVMKMLYDSLVTKHGNEVENLVNKLRDFEESKNQLQTQIDNVTAEYSKITKDFELKDNNLKAVMNVLSQIRDNIKVINEEIPNAFDSDKNSELVNIFKENLLQVLDSEFNLSSVNIFESLINNIASNHEKSLNEIMKQYTELQQHVDNVMSEFTNLNEHLKKVKSQLAEKEDEASLLRAQKERLHEISNVVTKDIVELHNILTSCYERLKRDNIMKSGDIDLTQSLSRNVNLLFERLMNPLNYKNKSELEIDKENLILEVNTSKKNLEEKDKLLETLKMNLLNTEEKLQAQLSLHEDVYKLYESSVEENMANVRKIENLTEEIKVLQQTVLDKESTIQALESGITSIKKTVVSENQMTITELTQRMKDIVQENESLKTINEVIRKEKESYSIELEKSNDIINKNKAELDRMTADILVLRETVRDNVSVIETLTLEAKSLLQQNEQMKKLSEGKCQNCSRLEVNIKTHEKTAEIQSRMIVRLQKQKEQDDQVISDKDKQLEELTNKCLALQTECENMKDDIKTSKNEIDGLKNVNQSLETRVSELEMEVEHANKHRLSIDMIVDNARRRRQSLHDSQRVFAEHFEDHQEMEAVFGSRVKPDDLFMEVDDNGSNRSTPNRLSKGRDSIHTHSDKDEDSSSRPGSVLATRRRRQSTHDLHRSVIRHTPSPRDSMRLIDELKNLKSDTSGGISNESEVSQLRQCLTSCQQELEEWKEKYKELDDECETCAQYLRERDDQCVRLKKDKADLEKQVAELNDKLKANVNLNGTVSKPNFAHASVNTDEDWANLHSVVVDRMSFDAEVEKNKKLTKTIEELRHKNQGLKNTLVKMQKALEKHASYIDSRELEVTKTELKACKQELEELKQQYKELDEECEICAQYLRERDEQCQKLKAAKAELEAKLQELQEDSGSILKTVRKKRQSLHDQNRAPSADLQDATTETSDDILSYQVERDESSRAGDNALAHELKQVRTALEKVSKEKAHLEQMMSTTALPSIQPTMFVATGSGIVQNQQLTDVMKENHKLKKMNAKLIQICKKRGKYHESNRENEEPTHVG